MAKYIMKISSVSKDIYGTDCKNRKVKISPIQVLYEVLPGQYRTTDDIGGGDLLYIYPPIIYEHFDLIEDNMPSIFNNHLQYNSSHVNEHSQYISSHVNEDERTPAIIRFPMYKCAKCGAISSDISLLQKHVTECK